MRRVILVLCLAAAVAALAPGRAAAADECGRPERVTNWIDTGSTALTDTFARPGVILAVSTGEYPAQVRGRGAITVYWDNYLNKLRVGLPSSPFDPATIEERANKLFDFAVAQSSCSKPWIAENEMAGAGLETPWSEANAQYRQNLLTFLQTLAARGARPFLLVNSAPYTGGEAAAWWQQVAAVADIVRETYFSAKRIHAQGPIVGNRTIRQALRTSVGRFLAIGIPASRLGVMLGFQSNTSSSGRAGVTPAQAWFDVVKWQALAARQVAEELKFSTIWSWGWQSYSGIDDPDKKGAACVWFWTRARSLCDGPAAAGPGWNASTTEGQLRFGPGVRCKVGKEKIIDSAISRLQALTADREVAYSALFARSIESRLARVTPAQVRELERSIVASRFGGSYAAYRAGLADAGASQSLARSILSDELRRAKLLRGFKVAAASMTEVKNFYESYPDVLVRPVAARPGPSWLGGKTKGYVIEAVAPPSVFTLPATKKARTLQTFEGDVKVRPLGDAQELGTMPLSVVTPAIREALKRFAQGDAFEQWTTRVQTAALSETICRGDDLPVPAPAELDRFVPFLSAFG